MKSDSLYTEHSLTIKDILYFLKRNYIKIISITFIFFLMGCYYILNTKPIYESSASIIIDSDNSNSLEDIGLGYSQSNPIEDKIKILTSRNISEATIENLIKSNARNNLFLLGTKDYRPEGYIRKAYEKYTEGQKVEDSKKEKSFSDEEISFLAARLMNLIKVSNSRDNNIINIYYSSLDPNEAAFVVNTFIDTYISKEKQWANQEISQQINFLEQQIKKKKITLEHSENNLRNFQEIEGIYNMSSNTELLLQQFLSLEDDLVRNKLSLQDVINRKKIYKNEIKKEGISTSYSLAVKDSIRSIEILGKVFSDKIDKLNNELDLYQKDLDELPRKMVEYFRLERLKNIEQETYLLMMRRLDESRIIAESQIGVANILDKALPNFVRSKPKIEKDLAISILIGLIVSILVSIVLELFNSSIKTVQDIEKFGLSVLAIIPSIKSNKRIFKKRYKNKKGDLERRLILSEDPKSPISEAYRTLRTSIMYSDTKDIKTIMVSSPGPGEGKTTTIANMAITYANLNKKTLLVDTDLRKPVLKKVFKINQDLGITNCIIENTPLSKAINKTDTQNLDVLCSGVIPPNPSELIDSVRMKEIIEEMKENYDIILFDTPPIVAVTDAIILSKNIDRFILVCRSEVTQKGAMDRVIKNIEHVNSKLHGCVLNALDNINSYGSGYYYNYYQYYYGDSNEK